MLNSIQKYNLRIIKWLNVSYDNRGNASDFLWSMNPTVFIFLSARVFFIFSKIALKFLQKILFIQSRESEGKNYSHMLGKIYLKDLFKISILNILLYRKNYMVSNKKTYVSRALLSVKAMKAMSLEFKKTEEPLVSIIIPVYNKIPYTFNCLLALSENVSSKVSYEIIIINDNSKDETKKILSNVEGINLINNPENLGFILSCNKGAANAKGKYFCFLNNDTEVQSNWLESMVNTFKNNSNAGLVGSMLIYPNNQMQEAGGIIWSDATGWNYGRLQNFIDPRYNFVRPADYCSGASILIKREDFETLNGFDINFVPAYYEDTDLCFSVRNKLNKQVLYQPESKLIHHEGITSGTSTSSGIKRFQDINAKKFKIKWEKELQLHLPNSPEHVQKAITRFCGNKTIIIIDTYVPMYDKESGSYRMYQLIKILKELKYHVIFVPDNENPEEPYTRTLQQMGVEVLYTTRDYTYPLIHQIRERLSIIDFAWICRPGLAEKYMPVFRSNSSIKIIYDTIDLHYIRLKREAELYPERNLGIDWKEMKKQEIQVIMSADKSISITDTDKKTLEDEGVLNVETIPNIHVPYSGKTPAFEKRKGLLFIGGYNHKPNIDSVLWLCNEIMPKVWETHPEITVTLLGSNPPENVLKLASSKVDVPGFIEDVSSYFLNSRVFVAPLPYGAGMKGKIGQSLEYSLPVISTSIGAEGMDLKHGYNCLIAETTEEFVAEIIRLYLDENLWKNISSKSHEAIYSYSPFYVKEKLSSLLDHMVVQKEQNA